MTIHDLLTTTKKKKNVPPLDQERLLAHVLKKPREYLWCHSEKHVSLTQIRIFRRLLTKAARGTPLPYLTGSVPFEHLDFTVTPNVLIPRPETELLVDTAISHLQNTIQRHAVVDVGTGSGCIITSLAHTLITGGDHRHTYHAIDISPHALIIAKKNATRHNVAPLITFSEGNLLEPVLNDQRVVERPFLILANLPYLPSADMTRKKTRVSADEPRIALNGGKDGLDLITTLLAHCASISTPWSLIAEIDPRQERVLTHDLVPHVLPDRPHHIIRDYSGHARILILPYCGHSSPAQLCPGVPTAPSSKK